VNQKTRLAIVAGIIVAIAAGATFVAVSAPSTPEPTVDNGGNSTEGGRQITVDLSENLSVEAK
jgi:hypothetical protein